MMETSPGNARSRAQSAKRGRKAQPIVDECDRIDGAAFPASGSIAARLRFALNFAVLAPSSHNTQPWRFIVQERSVLVCADRTRALPVIDPYDRELIISCGAALFNLRVALARFGQPYRIGLFPYKADPDVLAEVHIEDDGFRDEALAALFPAIRLRSTDRGPFSTFGLSQKTREGLGKAAAEEGCALHCIQDADLKLSVAGLVAEGDRRQFSHAAFRRELASWIHGSRTVDGMPAYSQGAGELLDRFTPVVSAAIRTFDLGGRVAASHHDLAAGSPLLAVLSTPRDDAESWLCAGQALERVLLLAAQAGYSASYLNQPIEVGPLRPRLRALAGSEKYPQLLLRLGKGRSQAVAASPRRPLADVLA